MSFNTHVYLNRQHHACISVAAEEIDQVFELLRIKDIAAEVHAQSGTLTEVEFIDQSPSRVSLLLDELRKHG